MKKLFKKRKYTLKNKLYLEADYLNKTDFKIGTPIAYTINYDLNTVTITTSEVETRNHVAGVTQTRNKKTVPTIDLRKSDVKEFVKNAGELEVSVYEDRIVFSVMAKENESLQEELLKDSNNNIIELSSYRHSKFKSFAVNMSSEKIVVGGEQLTLSDLFSDLFQHNGTITDYKKLKSKLVSMVSLFSGCGMLDKGFLDNGNFDIKFAVDKYEKKRLGRHHLETYRQNIGNHIIEKDVLELSKEDIPKVDFVVGGVPCVEFSKLNTKNNFRDRTDTNFPLLDQFLNVVKWSNAKGFLIENVKEFLSKDGVLIERIKNTLSNFNITYKIIDSSELGSAQSRKRLFILGFKNAIPRLELPKLVKINTVRDAFKNINTSPQQDIYLDLKNNYLEMAKHIPAGGNGKCVPEHLRPNRTFDNFIQRLHFDKHAPTITGLDSDYILHPELDRKLSVRECARLFSLDDNFIFYGSRTSIFTQLKNGVDYKVSSFLAKTIYEQMQPIL